MAYAHGITRDDVYSAASNIFSQGKNPTQAAVRSALGKGSFATISKYLQEWRQEQQDSGIDLAEGQVVPEEYLQQFQRFYWGLRSNVETAIVSEQVGMLEQENEQLHQRQENYDAIAAELAGLRFAYQEALNRLERLTRENERLEQRLKGTSASVNVAPVVVPEVERSDLAEVAPKAKPVNKGGRPRKIATSSDSSRSKPDDKINRKLTHPIVGDCPCAFGGFSLP